jgi:hypothetical protein
MATATQIEAVKNSWSEYPHNCGNQKCWKKAANRAQLEDRFGWRQMNPDDPLSLRPQSYCRRCRSS